MSEKRRRVFTPEDGNVEARDEYLKHAVDLVMPHLQKAITAGDWKKVEQEADQIMIIAQNVQDDAA